MKHLSVTFIFIFFVVITKGQIIYEHTYNGTAGIVELTNSGCKYYVTNIQTEQLKLYNMDHSIWKTINLDIPGGYELLYVYNVAEMLYTLDGDISCSYTYYKTSPSLEYETRVIDENGNILITIQDATSATPRYACDEGAKLIATITDYYSNITTTKVYGLPGEIYTGSVLNSNYIQKNPYPNPAKSMINIPYHLPENVKEAEIVINNIEGKLIRKYRIDNTFEDLIINTTDIPNGLYFYYITSDGFSSEAVKIIIQ